MFLIVALTLFSIGVLGVLASVAGYAYSRHRLGRRHTVNTDVRSLAAVTRGPDGFLHLTRSS